MCTPRYQDIKSKDINSLTDDDGTHIRVIALSCDYTVLSGCYDDGTHHQTLSFDTRRQGFAYVFDGIDTGEKS